MRRGKCITSLIASLVAFATVQAQMADQTKPSDDVRGLWVVRTSLTSPRDVEAVVSRAKAGGFNALFVQVRGRGEALYHSALEPRASELDGQPAAFDPLAQTLDLAHRAGLQVHAWVNVNLVASGTTLPRSREHIVFKHPEWLMVPQALAGALRGIEPQSPGYIGALSRWTRAEADQVEGLYLSPIPAGSQKYTVDLVRELATGYALDGLHFDYIRYPAESFDYSPAAIAAFRAARLAATTPAERQHVDRLADSDPKAWPEAFPDGWIAFRRDRLTQLMTQLQQVSRAARPDLIISAAVIPNGDEARDRRLQDWQRWAASGLLDVVCPMVYTTDAAEFTSQLSRARALAGPTPVWAGIGAYRLPIEETVDRVRAARKAGAAGVVLFRYDSLTSQGAGRAASLLSDLRTVLLEGDKARGGTAPPR